jgi:hypothetical protein
MLDTAIAAVLGASCRQSKGFAWCHFLDFANTLTQIVIYRNGRFGAIARHL